MAQAVQLTQEERELLPKFITGDQRKHYFDLATTAEQKAQILEFCKLVKADRDFCKRSQKEVSVTVLFKRVIASLDPEVTTVSAFYKQTITYKINPKHDKNWVLTAAIQRSDEALSGISEDFPERRPSYTCIVYLIATKFNDEFAPSPQPLTQNFSKDAWFKPYVDISFGKKTTISAEKAVEILKSGRSIGFYSEDFVRRYI